MTRERLTDLLRDCSAGAAAEMAFVAPLLLVLMFGAAELGNYFLDQHKLEKAVRDGARFAARQDFSNYGSCSGDVPTPGTAGSVNAQTKDIVKYGYLSGSTLLTPNISDSDITVTTQCYTGTVGGQSMSGIYKDRANGAQVVTVTASVAYLPVLGAFGFTGAGFHLNATSQAAVTGL